MAAFNPSIPEPTAQSFINDSRPISPFELKPDESGKILAEGAGKLFDETVTAGDKVIKMGLDQTINDQAGATRDQFTDALESQRAALTAQTQPKPEQAVPDLLSATPMSQQAAIPPSVNAGIANATAVAEAGKQGKLGSELDYYGRLNSILKDLRSNNPGYRDYIDAKMKDVTGVDPANAVVKANLDYISNATAKMNADKNRVLSVIDREDNIGIPGITAYRQAVINGRPNAEADAIAFVNKYQSKFAANKAALSDSEVALKGDDVQKKVAERALTSHIITMSAAHNEGVDFGSNINPDDMADLAQKVQSGKMQLDTNQVRQYAIMNDQNTATLTKAIRNWASQPQAALGGQSILQVHGDEAVNKMIENGLSGQKAISKAFLDKDLGAVDSTKRGIEDINNDTGYHLLQDGYGDNDIRTMTRLNAAAKNLFSPNAKGYIDMSNLGNGLSKHINALFQTMNKHAVVADINKNTGEPSTLSGDIDYAKSKGIGSVGSIVATDSEASKFYQGSVERVQQIGNPEVTDEGARHLVDYAFKPQNATNIYKLGSTPEEKMQMVKDLTDTSITDRVAGMDKTRQTYYRNWAETSYGVAVRPYLLQLQSYGQTVPWLHQGWDNENHEVVVTGTTPKGVVEDTTFSSPYADQGILQKAKDLAAKINDGLHNISHIEESTKGDVNAYLLHVLNSNGLTPENSKLVQGVVQSGKAPVKPDETKDTFGNKVKGKTEDRVFSSPQ